MLDSCYALSSIALPFPRFVLKQSVRILMSSKGDRYPSLHRVYVSNHCHWRPPITAEPKHLCNCLWKQINTNSKNIYYYLKISYSPMVWIWVWGKTLGNIHREYPKPSFQTAKIGAKTSWNPQNWHFATAEAKQGTSLRLRPHGFQWKKERQNPSDPWFWEDIQY